MEYKEILEEQAVALTDPELEEGEEQDELYEHFSVTVDKGQSMLRIDKYLVDRLEHCSRSRVQAAADSGSILVNGKAVKSSYKVKPLDRISIVSDHCISATGSVQAQTRDQCMISYVISACTVP